MLSGKARKYTEDNNFIFQNKYVACYSPGEICRLSSNWMAFELGLPSYGIQYAVIPLISYIQWNHTSMYRHALIWFNLWSL